MCIFSTMYQNGEVEKETINCYKSRPIIEWENILIFAELQGEKKSRPRSVASLVRIILSSRFQNIFQKPWSEPPTPISNNNNNKLPSTFETC